MSAACFCTMSSLIDISGFNISDVSFIIAVPVPVSFPSVYVYEFVQWPRVLYVRLRSAVSGIRRRARYFRTLLGEPSNSRARLESDPDSNSNRSQLLLGCSIRRISKAPKLKGRSTDLQRIDESTRWTLSRSRRLIPRCKSCFTMTPSTANDGLIWPTRYGRWGIYGFWNLCISHAWLARNEETFFAGRQRAASPDCP